MGTDDWEVFDGRRAFYKRVPQVTLQAKGAFGLSRAAYEAIGSPAEVLLLWNPRRREVGIRPAPPDDPRAYPARKQSGSESIAVAAKALLNHLGIQPGKMRVFTPRIEDNTLIIQLDDPTGASDAHEHE